MAEEQRSFGGRYHLVRHVARGGMAQVYLARDSLLDRDVALKVLFPELSVDESFVERFRREAQAAAKLAHPNIVSIYDWGQDERTYFIVMEYIDGETLSARIRRGPMPAEQAAIVGIATSSALAFAHRRNVIHRDVKPGNVLIDRSGQVKVADFGIARAVGASENLTQAGAVMGTATYFSPEQAQGLAVDARSDVYSLGVVLYEMAAGRPPFSGENPVAIAYQHVRESAPPLREVAPGVPAAYEAVVARAMSKDPADRYQTADDLRADLERYRAGQPVVAAGAAGAATALAGAPTTTVTRVNAPVEPTVVGAVPPGAWVAGDATGVVPVEPPPRKGRSAWWILLLVVLLAVLAALGYLLYTDLAGRKALVPSVARLSQSRAESVLKHAGFGDVIPQTVTSAAVPVGQAVGTSPRAGSRVSTSAAITLDVSGGPGTVSVPSVAGDTPAQATTALHGAGLKVQQAQVPSSVTPGRVVRTSPGAQVAVARGTLVTIYVSSGPRRVAIPNLAGDTPSQAGATLAAEGLKVGPQKSQSSSSVPSGSVIGTDPAAGNNVQAGTSVSIIVSTGQPQVSVPNVIGDTKSAALAALRGVGLSPSAVNVSVNDPAAAGLVQAVNPPASTSVTKGTQVTVDVGVYTPPSTTAPPSTTVPTTTVPATTTPTTTPTTSPSTTTTPTGSVNPASPASAVSTASAANPAATTPAPTTRAPS